MWLTSPKGKVSAADMEAPKARSMTDFDDRDLVRLAGSSGFGRIHLECHVDITQGRSLMRERDLDLLL